MKNFYTLFLTLVLAVQINAQDSLFARVYYNLGEDMEVYTATRALDGGIVMAGSLVMKVDSLGNVLWKRALFSGFYTGVFTDLIATKDSSYVAVGRFYNLNENKALAFVTKFNLLGDTLWTRQLGLTGQTSCNRSCIAEGLDSSYIISWSNGGENRAFLTKFDPDGNLQWDKVIEGGSLVPKEVIQAEDSSIYLLTDLSFNNGSMLKFDGNGNLLWNRTYAPCTFEDWEFVGDSIYVALVDQNSNSKGIALFDTIGNLSWTSVFPGGFQDWIEHAKTNMCMLSDTSFVLQSPSQMVWNNPVIRCDKDGNLLLNKQVEFAGIDVLPADHNGVYLIGAGPLFGIKSFNQKHIGIVRADTTLTSVICTVDNGNQISQPSNLTEVTQTFSISSGINFFQQNYNVILPNHTDYIGCVSAFGSLTELEGIAVVAYPNPVSGNLTVSITSPGTFVLRVIAISGQEIGSVEFSGSAYELDCSSLSGGLYVLDLSDAQGNQLKRTRIEVVR